MHMVFNYMQTDRLVGTSKVLDVREDEQVQPRTLEVLTSLCKLPRPPRATCLADQQLQQYAAKQPVPLRKHASKQ